VIFAQVPKLVLPLTEVSPELVIEGTPLQGSLEFSTVAGSEVGVWEMTPGIADDVEVDEVFVVVSGRATVAFLETDEIIELSAGSLCRLNKGQRTRWVVTETLRKVYVVAAS
jgi:uncharacterized cupin superfamily protein